LIWTLAIVSALALPVLALSLPRWVAVTMIAAPSAVAPPANPDLAIGPTAEPQPIGVTPALPTTIDGAMTVAQPVATTAWPRIIAVTYAAGAAVMMLVLAIQWRSVRRLARDAAEVQDPEWRQLFGECAERLGLHRPVSLRRSRERNMPMALGIRRPAIVMPSVAETWPDDRRRAVLLHELAHVARRDCLSQSLAMAACAMYWFHPAMWWVARQLRAERELACDDLVLAAGTAPREYASHLLEIAYAFGQHQAPALVVGMARPRQLEGRLTAILDAARNRTVPANRVRAAAGAVALLMVAVLASATAQVVAERGNGEAINEARVQHRDTGRHLMPIRQALEQSVWRVVRDAAALFGIAQDAWPGTWDVRLTDIDGIVHIRIRQLSDSRGWTLRLDELEGLTAEQLRAGGAVQFRLPRDAGTFTFEGVSRNGVAGGTFGFIPNPSFRPELASRGHAPPSASEQYQMALHDIGFAYIDELTRQGYAKTVPSELARAGQHGVDLAYLRGMGAQGYRLGALDALITLRDHGVTPDYIRDLAEYGYTGLSAEAARQARDHGVTPEFIRGLRDAGHSGLSLDEIIRVRDHGVSPDYVRTLRELGYGSLTMPELVNARDHGVDAAFVRGMAALGYRGLPMSSLVRTRDHGVTPEYAQEVKALGYDGLSLDELITLRDHGLTPERIRAANTRAGTRLPIDLLKSLAAGGLR
jgi:beta-lactamase regulating signal transducer with metallopeptidase domain